MASCDIADLKRQIAEIEHQIETVSRETRRVQNGWRIIEDRWHALPLFELLVFVFVVVAGTVLAGLLARRMVSSLRNFASGRESTRWRLLRQLAPGLVSRAEGAQDVAAPRAILGTDATARAKLFAMIFVPRLIVFFVCYILPCAAALNVVLGSPLMFAQPADMNTIYSADSWMDTFVVAGWKAISWLGVTEFSLQARCLLGLYIITPITAHVGDWVLSREDKLYSMFVTVVAQRACLHAVALMNPRALVSARKRLAKVPPHGPNNLALITARTMPHIRSIADAELSPRRIKGGTRARKASRFKRFKQLRVLVGARYRRFVSPPVVEW
jgi:hypothetical protein